MFLLPSLPDRTTGPKTFHLPIALKNESSDISPKVFTVSPEAKVETEENPAQFTDMVATSDHHHLSSAQITGTAGSGEKKTGASNPASPSVKKSTLANSIPASGKPKSPSPPAAASECQHRGVWRRILTSHHMTQFDDSGGLSRSSNNNEPIILMSKRGSGMLDDKLELRSNVNYDPEILESPLELFSKQPETVNPYETYSNQKELLSPPTPPTPAREKSKPLNRQKVEEIRNSLLSSGIRSDKRPSMTFRRSSGVLDRDISQSFIKPPALITPPSPPSSPPISHPQPQTFSSLAGQHVSKEERRNLHTHHLSPHQLTPINNKNHNMQQQDQHPHGLAYLKELIWHSNQNVNGVKRSVSEAALQNKYGKVQEVVGKGAGGVVKLAHKSEGAIEKLFAVKEFRKRAKNESEKDYVKRLVNEYCISSSLHHPHIVETIDLLQDDQRHWVEVMEYCQGGDLYSVIHDHGPLNLSEANCLWKQLIYGVAYLHSMGVAHKDLKPENLVLDSSGCLKITDFGSSEVVKTAFEREAHKSRGVCGSTPYIAPEEWRNVEFDARRADIWSCGIIYFVMIYSRIPWRIATAQDANYRYFLSHRKGKFSPIDKLKKEMSQLLNAILEPDENKRIFISDILENSYFKSLQTCHSCDQHDSFAEFAGSSSSLRSSSPLDSSTIISSTYSDDYESNPGENYKTIETARKYNSITKFANEAKKKLGQRGVGKV